MLATEKHTILQQKITLLQPKNGYRAAIDSILLGTSLDSHHPLTILDVGTGVGTVSFVLAKRLPQATIYGIDMQEDLICCAQEALSFPENAFESSLYFRHLPLQEAAFHFGEDHFDAIVTNPPYTAKGKGFLPQEITKQLSNHETLTLTEWLFYIHKLLKPQGTLCLIHQAARLPEIVSFLDSKKYAIQVCPLWPKKGKEAKRIIIKAQKGSRKPFKLLQGLVLHEEGGHYTERTKRLVNEGASLFKEF